MVPFYFHAALKRAMKEVSRSRHITRHVKNPNISRIKEKWKSMQRKNLWEFFLSITQTLILHDFYLFLIFLGVPVGRNPRYRDMIDMLQRNYQAFEEGRPDARPIFVIKIPRGLMKSTIAMHFALWVYIRKAAVHKESTHALIGHGNDKKCADNIRLLSKIAKDEKLVYMYNKYLMVETDNELNVSFDLSWASINRREVTFSTVTPNKDPAGTHMNLAVIDDWATYENTKSAELARENERKFSSLFALDDHSKGAELSVFMLYICTPYAEDSITERIVNKAYVETYEAPCSEQLFDPQTTTESELIWPEILSLKKLRLYYEMAEQDLKWFRSQYDLVPYSRGGGLDFLGELPQYSHDICFSQNRAFCVVTADPKTSTKNKKGQAVVLVHVIDIKGNLHTVDGVAEVGMKASRHSKWIFDYATQYKADMVIIESVHYQIALKDRVEEDMAASGHKFQVKPHVHRQNKQEHYRAFLEPLLAAGRWFINPLLAELIKQVRGNSSLEDQVDCTSFMSEINIRSYAAVGSYAPETNRNPQDDYLQMNRHSAILKQRKKDNNVCYGEIGW